MSYNGTWCLAPNSELKNVASASLPSSKSIVCRMSLGAHANPKLCREGNSGKHSSNLAKLTWYKTLHSIIPFNKYKQNLKVE